MKYIDTEKLIAEIERRKQNILVELGDLSCVDWKKSISIQKGTEMATYDLILSLITSLQQEQPKVDLVAELKHHLTTTPKEQLEKEWKDLEHWNNIDPSVQEFLYGKQPDLPSGEEVMTMCNQILIDWVKEGKTQEEKEQREQAHIRFFELYDAYIMQEQPQQDITEFEKALHDFGEAYSMLVDRDNNPNQGIRINAYHELVQEKINEILSLAKEYVKQEKSEVDLEKEIDRLFEIVRGEDGMAHVSSLNGSICDDWKKSPYAINKPGFVNFARHFYELGLNTRKKE